MRILVTGSAGLVGSAVAEKLSARGDEIIYARHSRKFESIHASRANIIALDVGNEHDVEDAANRLNHCDAVVHAAASLDMEHFSEDVIRTNCNGINNLLWLSERWRAKFVYISSIQVIGTPKEFPITESHCLEPLSLYHASKLFGEYLVRVSERRGLIATSLRISSPIGPQMPSSRFFPWALRKAHQSEDIILHGSGKRRQNYIDTRDIAHAIECSLNSEKGGVYNIASDICISNRELVEFFIRRLSSKSNVFYSGHSDLEEEDIWDISSKKAKLELGFAPKYSIDDMVDQYLTSLKQMS